MPKFKKMQKLGDSFKQVGHIIDFNESNADTLNAQTKNTGIKYVPLTEKQAKALEAKIAKEAEEEKEEGEENEEN